MSFNVNTISAGSTAVLSRSAVAEQQLQVSQVMAGRVQENGNKVEDSRAVTSTFGTSADKIEISPEGRKALEQIYAQRAAKATAAKSAPSAEAASAPTVSAPAQAELSAPAAEAASTPAVSATAQVASPSTADAVKPAAEAKPAEKAEPVAPEAANAEKAVTEEAKAEEAARPQEEKPNPAQEKIPEEKANVEVPEAPPMPGSGETAAATEEGVSSSEIQNMSVSELRTLVTEGSITRAQMDSELSRRESAQQESEQKTKAAAEAMNEVFSSMKNVDKAAKNMNTYNTTMQYASVAQALT